MPPPKTKLYPKTGKHKTINTSAGPAPVPPSATASSSTTADAADAQGQLELELCWCIQTLEASIDSGKLNAKQVQDTEKTIKILKSGTQPVIKKRQVMRLAFGDYRARMAAEERKLRQNAPRIQFTERTFVGSHFVKKSALQSMGETFKFDFPVADRMTQLDLNRTEDDAAADDVATSSGTVASSPIVQRSVASIPLKSSDNTFKFNFNVDTE